MTKRSLIIFCTLVFILCALLPVLPLQGEQEIYDNTIRLHVIANSDSEEDQELKLKVRDSVLELMSKEFQNVSTKEEAKEKIEDMKDDISLVVDNTIRNNGYNYSFKITLSKELYPTREYEGVRLPSGEYLSLRILIGEAEGKNWWCVLFPALCTSSAKPKEKLKEAGFSSEQIKILTEGEKPKYVLRFRILELFN